MIPITAMQATTGYASNNTRSPKPRMLPAIMDDGSIHGWR